MYRAPPPKPAFLVLTHLPLLPGLLECWLALHIPCRVPPAPTPAFSNNLHCPWGASDPRTPSHEHPSSPAGAPACHRMVFLHLGLCEHCGFLGRGRGGGGRVPGLDADCQTAMPPWVHCTRWLGPLWVQGQSLNWASVGWTQRRGPCSLGQAAVGLLLPWAGGQPPPPPTEPLTLFTGPHGTQLCHLGLRGRPGVRWGGV